MDIGEHGCMKGESYLYTGTNVQGAAVHLLY